MIRRTLAEAIGNTPLIRLRRASEETGCEILAGRSEEHTSELQSQR